MNAIEGFKEGYFREGQFDARGTNGFGRCITTNGKVKIGWMKNNELHGYIKYTYASGKVYEGLAE